MHNVHVCYGTKLKITFVEPVVLDHHIWRYFFPYRSIHDKHSTWYCQHWCEIDTHELELETEQQLDLISTLPRAVAQDWDIFKLTEESVHVVQTTASLVDGLRRLVQCYDFEFICM